MRFFLLLALPFLLGWTGKFKNVQITIAYQEPATNVDGSPLTDLKSTEVWYRRPTWAQWKRAKEVLAVNPAGGKAITRSFQLPILQLSPIQYEFFLRAHDFNGNYSDSEIKYVELQPIAQIP